MYRAQSPSKWYEEYAYVLECNPRARSSIIRGREGVIVTSIGEDKLTILEVLGVPHSTFDVGERFYIGKDGRTKVMSVLGRLTYEKLSSAAKRDMCTVVEKIVTACEPKFVEYLNNAQLLTPRIHALELIPGIGKTYLRTMLDERKSKRFDSYTDVQERVGLSNLIGHITKRIMEEITGQSRMRLFVKR